MSVIDQLPYITSRIEAINSKGQQSIGTGFFFGFEYEGKGMVTTLITNKHVVEDAKVATIYVSRADKAGKRSFGDFNSWRISGIDQILVAHPDKEVDLAAFPVGDVFREMEKAGTPPYFRRLNLSCLPSEEDIKELTAVEDILMVGYPTGIWDKWNNIPVIRRGITATPYERDYNGRAEFMIDAACFPGSSGSPVLIVNQGNFSIKGGNFVTRNRLYLLGLLWGGPQYTAEGEIVTKPAPTASTPVSMSRILINLGYCVKSRMIRDLGPLILAKFSD